MKNHVKPPAEFMRRRNFRLWRNGDARLISFIPLLRKGDFHKLFVPMRSGGMEINMTNEEYKKYTDKKTPDSPIWKNMILAFLVGGAICALGQLFNNYFTAQGFSELNASSATAIALIFLSALFTGLDLYDGLAKYAGAGTIVPITGFANAVVSPAIEFKTEGYVLGVGAKMFAVAGPVVTFGVVSSAVAGILYYIFGR